MLIVDGLHVPAMPLFDVVESVGASEPWQSGPICVNVGVALLLTVMLIVVPTAHWPLVGVNV